MACGVRAQPSPTDSWLRTLQDHPETMDAFYTEGALRIFTTGKVMRGKDRIAGWWVSRKFRIDSVAIIRTIQPHKEEYRYEISEFRTREGKKFKQLIIWNLEKQFPRRELEVVVEVWPLKNFRGQLDARRAQWISHCNAHLVDQLVNEVYSDKAIYYNHGPLKKGRPAIIDTYQYMNNPAYQLKLEPILVEPVNDHVAYEIGQCSGSYPGKYILVWQKDEDGKWYILLDSNI